MTAPHSAPAITQEIPHSQVLRVLTGLMSGIFLAAVESTIVATAAPTIVEDLGGIDLISWLFTGYMLATTVSSALWGKLSDIVGRRPTFLAAISIFVGGSVLCGVSQNMLQLIGSRVVQGVGGGGLTSLSFAIMADILPPRRRGQYVGYISATFALGSVAGPVLGGLLVDWFHWRVVFLVNVPLGVAAGLISSAALRGVGGRRKARLDIAGAITLSAAIICVLLVAVWGGNEHDWSSPVIILLGAGAVALFVTFVAVERSAEEPVLAIRLLRNRTLMVAIVLGALTAIPFNAAVVYLPLFLQTVHDASVSGSGLQLAPLMVMMSVASIFAGRRVSRTGTYKSLMLGALVVGVVAVGWMAFIDESTGTVAVVLMMVLLGSSFGASSPVVNLAAQNAMPVADLGAASSALITFRSLGATIGIAGIGSVLVTQLRSGVAALPGGTALDAEAIASGPDSIAALAEPLRSSIVTVMADSIATALTLCLPVAIAAVIVGLFVPELPLRDHTEIEITAGG